MIQWDPHLLSFLTVLSHLYPFHKDSMTLCVSLSQERFCFWAERRVTCKTHPSRFFAFLRHKPLRRTVLVFLRRRRQWPFEKQQLSGESPAWEADGGLRSHAWGDGWVLYIGHWTPSNRAPSLARGASTPSSAHKRENLQHSRREAASCPFLNKFNNLGTNGRRRNKNNPCDVPQAGELEKGFRLIYRK